MFDPTQVQRVGDRYRIIAPYTSDQLTMIHRFLVPKPEGRGYFDNFVILNTGRSSYWQLSETAQSEKITTAPRLFDLWYLMTLTFPEVCGYNRRVGILGEADPTATKKMDPSDVEMEEKIFDQMAVQLIGVIRGINGDIPIVSNSVTLINRGPRIVGS